MFLHEHTDCQQVCMGIEKSNLRNGSRIFLGVTEYIAGRGPLDWWTNPHVQVIRSENGTKLGRMETDGRGNTGILRVDYRA